MRTITKVAAVAASLISIAGAATAVPVQAAQKFPAGEYELHIDKLYLVDIAGTIEGAFTEACAEIRGSAEIRHADAVTTVFDYKPARDVCEPKRPVSEPKQVGMIRTAARALKATFKGDGSDQPFVLYCSVVDEDSFGDDGICEGTRSVMPVRRSLDSRVESFEWKGNVITFEYTISGVSADAPKDRGFGFDEPQ